MRMQRPTVEVVNREEGDPNKHFLRKHGMDKHSHPMYWFNALLPPTPKDNRVKLKDINVKGYGKTKFDMSNWMSYTNMKASIAHAGEEGHIFA